VNRLVDKGEMKSGVPHSWGDERRGWHMDKTVSVSHIISTLLLAVSAFWWASSVDRRVDSNLQEIDHLTEMWVRERAEREASRREFKADLRDIGSKLDKMNDRLFKGSGR